MNMILDNVAQIALSITALGIIVGVYHTFALIINSTEYRDIKQKYAELVEIKKVHGDNLNEFNGQMIEITGQCVALDKPLFAPGTHIPVVMYLVEIFKNYVSVQDENTNRVERYHSSKEYKTTWGLTEHGVTIDVTDISTTNIKFSKFGESQNHNGSGEILNDYFGKKVLLGQTEKYSGIQEGCILTVVGKLHILSNGTYRLIPPGYFANESVVDITRRLQIQKHELESSMNICIQNIKISGLAILCYLFVCI